MASNYICNRQCVNNKFGWCKIFRQSTNLKKNDVDQSCDFYLDYTTTGRHKIDMAIQSLDKESLMNSDYMKGYLNGLKKALEYLNSNEVAMFNYESKRSK